VKGPNKLESLFLPFCLNLVQSLWVRPGAHSRVDRLKDFSLG